MLTAPTGVLTKVPSKTAFWLEKQQKEKDRGWAEDRDRKNTWSESERQSHSLGVSEGEQVFVGCEDRQLLEALASSPEREVVPGIIGLQRTTGLRR